MPRRIVYVSCGDAREIHSFTLDPATGALAPLAITPVPGLSAASNSMPLAITADRRHLYAALRSPPFPLVSFAIDATDGTLRQTGSALLPHTASYISTDRSGRWLLSASYAAAQIAVSPIDAQGVARDPVHQTAKTPPKVHSILASPDNRFLYSGCVGGAVLCWTFDAQHGLTHPDRPQSVPSKTARHIAFGHDATMLYVVSEADGTIDTFARDATTGALSLRQTIPSLTHDAHGHAASADIHLTPDGRFLYASLRTDSLIGAFRVDQADGTLSPIGLVPVETGPRSFAIDPDGRYLICAGRDAAAVGAYAIGAAGTLSKLGGAPTGANANWVEIIDLV